MNFRQNVVSNVGHTGANTHTGGILKAKPLERRHRSERTYIFINSKFGVVFGR